MFGLARALFRPGDVERLSISDWVEMFSFNGETYPINFGATQVNSTTEDIENDFESYVREGYKRNGVVFAAVTARARIFSQMRFQYQRLHNGRPGDLFSKPALGLFEEPWPNGNSAEALFRAIVDADLAGNSYMLKEFVKETKGYRLRRLRPDWVSILLTVPPDKAVKSDVKAYIYKPGNSQDPDDWEIYPIDGSNGVVAHWSPIPDPTAQYRGMSWLTPVLTDILADSAMDKHKAQFFKHGATPNLAISLKQATTPEQFEKFMRKVNRAHEGVDNAYKTLYLGGGADVHVIGTNLQQMDFKVTQGHGETRIASAAGIHPVILGLAEQMHGTPLNAANWQAAKDLLYESVLSWMWPSLCTSWAQFVPKEQGARLWYDKRDIAFLRQNRGEVADVQKRQAEVMSSLTMQGWIPDTIVKAVLANDWSLLKHSGMYSVQLWLPGQGPSSADQPQSQPTAPSGPARPGGPANANAAKGGAQAGSSGKTPAKPATPAKGQ